MKEFLLLILTVSFVTFGSCQLSGNQQDPCDHRHGVVQDAKYCDRFWECINGTPELYDCPNGLVFVGRNRGIADGCDYPWRGAYCQGGKQLANTPISTEHCDWLYGIFGHETSCTRYWTCWNGTSTEQFCIGGLLYNEETHACDWPQNVEGCQKHPLCTDDANGNVPLGESCERYWNCQGGYPRLQRCPATLVFEKNARRCVNPPTADCDVPPPPPPLPNNEKFGSPFRQGGGPPRQNNLNRGRRPQKRVQEVAEDEINENPIRFENQSFQEPSPPKIRTRPNSGTSSSRGRRPPPTDVNNRQEDKPNNFVSNNERKDFRDNANQGGFRANNNQGGFRNTNNQGDFRQAPIDGAIRLN